MLSLRKITARNNLIMNEPENNFRLPTLEEIEQEIERLDTEREIKRSIFDTIKNLIVIAAVAVLVSNLFIAVLTVNRSSM